MKSLFVRVLASAIILSPAAFSQTVGFQIAKCTGLHRGDSLEVTLSTNPRGEYFINYQSKAFGALQARASETTPSRYVNPQGISLTLGVPDVEGKAISTFRSPQTDVVRSTEVLCEIFQK